MQDDKTDNSSSEKVPVNQACDDKADQKATSEHYKEEAEQLLKFHRQDQILTPGLLLGILSVYLLFVGTVTGVGVLAYYSSHDTLREIFLIISIVLIIVLLLIIPISVIWYLWASFRKKATREAKSRNESLLAKFGKSPIGRLLKRATPFVIVFDYAMVIYFITDAILSFPQHPRYALVTIVIQMAVFFLLTSSLIAHSFTKKIDNIWKFNDAIKELVVFGIPETLKLLQNSNTGLLKLHERVADEIDDVRKHIADSEKSHSEIHRLIIAAVEAGIRKPNEAEAPTGEPPNNVAGAADEQNNDG